MINTIKISAAAALVATVAFGAATLPAKADSVELGMLQCVVEGGAGFIFGSSKDLACEYTPANAEASSEAYFGVINKFGIDIGFTGTTVIAWAVLAPTTDFEYQPGSLAGNYRGVSAEASAVAGAGVNLLVGGSDETFSLQPLSVQAQEGVNIAVGIAEIELRSTAN
ncbi:MAG: DUF992 domain-containing protein [Hoeflea sp.]|nr:DUF992 domain-containing protein [Alphaproteobacteria bacterium]MBV1725830.1 DUF992 domain-containing protein [Hoeflea sp.]MBU4543797.1 DUF992 domain-containing protein [Alphaproteobacteria bacterium]MBU4548664.1 DUF992 domain-containing protein [Alphaproteobacteria bacterium]MBV1762186.1 DUF992 domain-containing protein [Hoeflea sp.]